MEQRITRSPTISTTARRRRTAWLEEGKDAFRSVLGAYENYIDLEFDEVENAANANFVIEHDYNELKSRARSAVFDFPEATDDQSIGKFPFDWPLWTEWHLQSGRLRL